MACPLHHNILSVNITKTLKIQSAFIKTELMFTRAQWHTEWFRVKYMAPAANQEVKVSVEHTEQMRVEHIQQGRVEHIQQAMDSLDMAPGGTGHRACAHCHFPSNKT